MEKLPHAMYVRPGWAAHSHTTTDKVMPKHEAPRTTMSVTRGKRVPTQETTASTTNRGTTTPTTTDKYLPCEQWRTVSTDLRQSRDGPRSRGSTNEIAGTFDAGMPALRRANNSSRSVTSSTVNEQQPFAEIGGIMVFDNYDDLVVGSDGCNRAELVHQRWFDS